MLKELSMSIAVNNKQHIHSSAIIFSALIGIGLWITFAVFGGAIGMSFEEEANAITSKLALTLMAIGAIGLLTSTFFLAGFIASKVSHQKLRFDSIVHSLGTWAVMTVLLVTLISGATAANGIKNAVSGLKPPAVVTDMEVFKAKATTTIEEPKKSPQAIRMEKKSNKIIELVWWVSFISLLLGLGASILGGFFGREVEI